MQRRRALWSVLFEALFVQDLHHSAALHVYTAQWFTCVVWWSTMLGQPSYNAAPTSKVWAIMSGWQGQAQGWFITKFAELRLLPSITHLARGHPSRASGTICQLGQLAGCWVHLASVPCEPNKCILYIQCLFCGFACLVVIFVTFAV